MEDKKTSILALLKILEEFSDENHILSQPDLLNKLETNYNLILDRRTLYRNVDMLLDFGYDISTYSENGKGYYLRQRQFETSQIFLLCNAIHSSCFIPNSSSKELINKLLSTQSNYFKNEYRSTVYVENKDKKDNKEFFLNIELISDAIKNRKVISFNYTKYDLDKKLVNRRERPYVLSPYYLIYINERTYLIGKSSHYEGLSHYRVDRIKNINQINDKYLKPIKDEDPYVYAKTKIYMYHGDDNRIALKCDNSILDDVIDIFGKDIRLEACDEEHFIAYVKSSEQGMVYLALQYLDHMEVLEPKNIRDEITRSLKESLKKYKK